MARDTFEWWNPADWFGAHDEESVFRGGRTREEDRAGRRSGRSARRRPERTSRSRPTRSSRVRSRSAPDRETSRASIRKSQSPFYRWWEGLDLDRGLFESDEEQERERRIREGGDTSEDWFDDHERWNVFDWFGQHDEDSPMWRGGLTRAEDERREGFREEQAGERRQFTDDILAQAEEYLESLRGAEDQREAHLEDESWYDEALSKIEEQRNNLKEQYGVSEDLLDQVVQQAEEYRSSPSLVDAEIERTLASDLKNKILARQGTRSRFGQAPVGGTQDLVGTARSRIAGKLKEKQQRETSFANALQGVASGRTTISQLKDVAQRALLSSELGFGREKRMRGGALADLRIGRPSREMALRGQSRGNIIDSLGLKGWLDDREYEDRYGAAERRMNARNRQLMAGVQGLIGLGKGIGGLYTGNPVLAAGGLQNLGEAGNAFMGGRAQEKAAWRPFPGYHSYQGWQGMQQQPRTPYPGTSDFSLLSGVTPGKGLSSWIEDPTKNIFHRDYESQRQRPFGSRR